MSFLYFISFLLFIVDSKIRISEVVPHSDDEDGYYDYIELWNDGKKPEDISGHFLTDVGHTMTRCRIRNGTVLQPNQYRSFSCQGPNDVIFLPNADCPFRLSKHNEHIYYGMTDTGLPGGKYSLLDDMNIGATMNRVSNSLWEYSDKFRHAISFPTENFVNRYPIVGPLSITEIVFDPPAGKMQYIKVTCLYGQTAFTGTCRMSSWLGGPITIRLEQQKDLFTDAGGATPVSLSLPTTPPLDNKASYYIVSGTPANFKLQYPNLDSKFVAGPWIGALQNATTKEVFVGLCTKEHAGDYFLERLTWHFNDSDWRPLNNGGIRKLSHVSLSSEPKNWIGIGDELKCDLNSSFPQSDCPTIDKCTAHQCVNRGGVGVCEYSALVCNHPNWDLCYPDEICPKPYPARYNAGCQLTSKVFGHTTSDIAAFGFYGPYPEKIYYDVGCVNQAIDCDIGKWSDWSYCESCSVRHNRTRHRKIKLPPSKNPDGKPCPVLVDQKTCENADICGRLNWLFVDFTERWVDFFNPHETKKMDISGWVLKQNCDAKKTGIIFPKNTEIAPLKKFRVKIGSILNTHALDVFKNVLCLHEVDSDDEFTGVKLEFDQREFEISLD